MYRDIQAIRMSGAAHIQQSCQVAEEVPIGIHFNGIAHAVLMATPENLDDLAVGFSLTDGVCERCEIVDVTVQSRDEAVALDIRLSPVAFARFLQNRRTRVERSFSSCGLCGIESIGQLPIAASTRPALIDALSIRRALHALPAHQELNRRTGATHAASWHTQAGEVVLVREDVGRHNALDKLIGARTRIASDLQQGFCVVTSRCSFEMVQKATVAQIGLLVCISAPTSLAVALARRAGLALVALARADSQTIYAGNLS